MFKISKKIVILVVIFFTLLLLKILAGSILNNYDNLLKDSLYTYNNKSDDIVIISVDTNSTNLLGKFDDWRRTYYGDLLNKIKEYNPKIIFFDFIFNTYTNSIPTELLANSNDVDKIIEGYSDVLKNPEDLYFNESMKDLDVVLAGAFIDEKPVFPIKIFRELNDIGLVNIVLDDDGVLRRSYLKNTYNDQYYLDSAILIAEKFLGENISKTLETKENTYFINYFSEPFSYKQISFIDVLDGNFTPDYFENKIVLVGVTDLKQTQDAYITPKDRKTPMPGVEIRANAIQTILDQKFLVEQSTTSQIIVLIILITALTFLLTYTGILISTAITFASIIAYYLAAHLAYRNGLLINMIYPFIAIILTYIATWVYRYFIADKDKRKLKGAFSHYVSKDVVDEISKNPEQVKLGGEKRIITVFFSDIKDSTTHSEKLAITDWVKQINEYFTVMEMTVQKHGGTIDKFEGDAIMGFWNAPLKQEKHISNAWIAALDMRKALKQLHIKWQKEGKPLITFRIGINTGEALIGNFGSINRFDYTAMGDTVNTASRLESSANKTYGTTHIVSGFKGLIPDENLAEFILRELDTVILQGKNEPTTLYELLCLKSEATPQLNEILETYARGLLAYRSKNFALAMEEFGKLKDSDFASNLMYERSKKLLINQEIFGLNLENMVYRIIGK